MGGYTNNFIILPWYPAWLLQPLSYHHMDSLYSHHSYWERQRDTERQRKERMKREKTLLTQHPVFLLCINVHGWLPGDLQLLTSSKCWATLGSAEPIKPGLSTVHMWLCFLQPWAGWSYGSFQCLCTPSISLSPDWMVCPCIKESWLHKHTYFQINLFPSFSLFPFTV